MRTLIYGAGAMGSLVGGLLAQNYEVTLLGREQHMSTISETGLRITGLNDITVHPNAITDLTELPKNLLPELIIITVKSYDTQNIIPEIQKIINDNTIILSLQNGLDNEHQLKNAFPDNTIVGGVTCHGITFLEPGHVYHAGTGETQIGVYGGENTEKTNALANMLNDIGIKVDITDNIEGEIWAKVAVNASINPITAITGLKNGSLLKIPELTKLLEATCKEVIRVAKASKISLPSCNILEKTKNVVRNTAGNKSSMLQDIERGKRTEIDSINGAVAKIGLDHNTPTPVNESLTTLVKGIEANTYIDDEELKG
jgi:2-dehydropantoate 2-reductase